VQLPVSFLSSRVTCADEDDWKKLKRMLQYLNGTVDMPLTLSIDNISVIKTWVDAAYGVHNDNMRSQTGGTIMMGKGRVLCIQNPANRKSIQKVQLKQNWLEHRISCPKQFGLQILLRHKVTSSTTVIFRQHERNADGTKRASISRSTVTAYKYSVFLY
jgi:hypothetical protein